MEKEEWFPIACDGGQSLASLGACVELGAAPTRLARVSQYCHGVNLSNIINKALKRPLRVKLSVA